MKKFILCNILHLHIWKYFTITKYVKSTAYERSRYKTYLISGDIKHRKCKLCNKEQSHLTMKLNGKLISVGPYGNINNANK